MLDAGISTRGAMVLLRCAKCVAWMRDRNYVVPEDVKVFALDILAHRMQPKSGVKTDMAGIITSILEDIPAP
jgi:MoxR-like ATPase